MKKVFSLLLFLVFLAGAYFLLRTRVLWLDYFDGVIADRYEVQLPTVREGRLTQELSEYYWKILTADDRVVEVEVPQDRWFRSRPGMKVSKGPFTDEVDLIE